MKRISVITLMLLTVISISFAQQTRQNRNMHNAVPKQQKTFSFNTTSKSLQRDATPTITPLTFPVTDYSVTFDPQTIYTTYDGEYLVQGYVFSITLDAPKGLTFSTNIPESETRRFYIDIYTTPEIDGSSYIECPYVNTPSDIVLSSGTYYLYFEMYEADPITEPFTYTFSVTEAEIQPTIRNISLDYNETLHLAQEDAFYDGYYYNWFFSFNLAADSIVTIDFETETQYVYAYCSGNQIGPYTYLLQQGAHVITVKSQSCDYDIAFSITKHATSIIKNITLDYSETLQLTEENGFYTMSDYFWMFDFDLSEQTFVNIDVVADEQISNIYTQGTQVSSNNFMLRQGHNIVIIFADAVNFEATVSITKNNNLATDINLNYVGENLSITNQDLLAEGQHHKYYRFTLTEASLVYATISSEQNPNVVACLYDENLFSTDYLTSGSRPAHFCQPGTYYFCVYDGGYITNEAVESFNFDFSATAIPVSNIRTVELPFAEKQIWTAENLDSLAGMKGKLLKFNVPNEDVYERFHMNFLHVHEYNYLYYYAFADGIFIDFTNLSSFNTDIASQLIVFVPADDILINYSNPNIVANIFPHIELQDLNYDNINIAETVIFTNNEVEQFVYDEHFLFGYAKGYSLTLDEPTALKLSTTNTYNVSETESIISYIIIFNEDFSEYFLAQSATITPINAYSEYTTTILPAGTYKIFEGWNDNLSLPNFDLQSSIRLDTIPMYNDQPSQGDFVWETMSLPFVATLTFNENHNVMPNPEAIDDYFAYKRGFTLTLEETTKISYSMAKSADDNYNSIELKVFTNQEMTEIANYLGTEIPNLNEHMQFTLEAGTYYLVFEDNSQSSDTYNIMLEAVPILNTITLDELLNDENIQEVDYTADLPFAETGWRTIENSALVIGNDALFGNDGSNYFASAYKITNMQEDDTIKIHVSSNVDAYAYIYKKVGENFEIIESSDDDWEEIENAFPNYGTDSYIEFVATEETDYYLVATDYESMEAGTFMYSVTMWTGGIDAQPEVEQPALATILSTTASQTEIHFDDIRANVTDNDRKLALSALEISATLDSDTTIVVPNNPFLWTITETQATYENVAGYAIAENYVPAHVNFTYEPTPYTISGTVRDAENNPMAGVTITLTETSSNPTREAVTATTGEDGTYSLTGIEAHAYTIAATKEGYTFAPETIAVAAMTANLSEQDFVGTAIPQEFTISGTVRNAENIPMAGVTITLTETSSTPTREAVTATTSEDGTYSLTGIEAHAYTIAATKEGYTFAPETIAVAAMTANLSEQDFVGTAILQEFTISGTVRDAENNPMAGVEIIYFVEEEEAPESNSQILTAEDGTYSITVQANATYILRATKEGYSFAPEVLTVEITNANVTDQDFVGQVVTSISDELSANVSAYPNPATDFINIDGLSGNEQIQIFDATGRLVISQTANSNIATINVSRLAQGSYLVKICKEDAVEVVKFVK